MQAVIFDVFGTLLKIDRHKDPFNSLSRMAIQHGIQVPRTALHEFMCKPLSLSECAQHLHFTISPKYLKKLERQLEEHLATVELFPEVEQVLSLLRERGIKIAACSNLALPYGALVKTLLPGLDAYVLSYEVGKTKPNPSIYQLALTALGVEAGATCMIGDSLRCDKRGPGDMGIQGYWLNREGASGSDFRTLLEAKRLFQAG